MEKKSLNVEQSLYIFALILALLVRFTLLNEPSLTEVESSWAWEAYQVANGQIERLSSQPGYTMLTATLFFMFGSSDLLARFLPALLGSISVLIPYFYRQKLGSKAALILTFLIALDPGHAAISRQAGGAIFAVMFLLSAITAWKIDKPILTGILSGLAFLSGPDTLKGLPALLLAWVAAQLIIDRNADNRLQVQISSPSARSAGIAFITTLILISTLFLIVPQGFSSLGQILTAYLGGWTHSSGIPISRLLLALLVYQPCGLLFGLIGLFRAWIDDNHITKALGLWFFFSLLFAFLYPNRQVSDLVWVVLPLLALASVEISRSLQWNKSTSIAAVGLAVLVVVLLAFVWFDIASLPHHNIPATISEVITDFLHLRQSSQAGISYPIRILLALAVIFIGILSIILINMGWSRQAALQGTVWGLLIAFAVYLTSAAFSTPRTPYRMANELWAPLPTVGQRELMMDTLGDLSEWDTGTRDGAVILYQPDNTAMHWTLRVLPNAKYTQQPEFGKTPPIIITTREDQSIVPSADYRGQSFVWLVYPDWSQMGIPDWIRWVLYREAPTVSTQVVLWGRLDLFPEEPPEEEEAPDQPSEESIPGE
jgi:hypothetical protein